MRNRTILLTTVAFLVVAAAGADAGTLVVANKSEATVSLVDTRSGEVRATLPTGDAPHEVDVSPDGRLALVGNYGTRDEPGSTLTVVDVAAAEVVGTIDLAPFSRPHGIVWLDDRFAVVTAEEQKELLKVDVTERTVVQDIDTDAEISHMVAVANGQSLAFVANIGSGSVTAIDLALGKIAAQIPTGEGAEGIAVTPNGRQVWVTNRAENTISVISTSSLAAVAKIEAGEFPIRAEATADGRFVLVTNARGDDLSVFAVKEKQELGRIEFAAVSKDAEGRLFSDRFGTSSVPIGIEIVDDEKKVYVAHANADDISVVDMSEWKVTGTLSAGREPDGMGYSPLEVKNEE